MIGVVTFSKCDFLLRYLSIGLGITDPSALAPLFSSYIHEAERQSYFESIKHDWLPLSGVPSEFITREMCLAALEKNPISIRYVPRELITRDMCLDAVRRAGIILHFIPSEFKDYEICLTAIKRINPDLGDYF